MLDIQSQSKGRSEIGWRTLGSLGDANKLGGSGRSISAHCQNQDLSDYATHMQRDKIIIWNENMTAYCLLAFALSSPSSLLFMLSIVMMSDGWLCSMTSACLSAIYLIGPMSTSNLFS